MTESIMKAPVFTRVVSSGIDASKKTLSVSFLDAENKRYQVEVSIQCAGLAIIALLSEWGKLLAKLPDQGLQSIQPIVATGMKAAVKDDNATALVFHLENGASLVIEIPRDQLSGIARMFDELNQASAPPHTKH